MEGYIITVIGMVLICSFALMLCPDGEGGGLRKYMGLLSSLCVLCVLISPVMAVSDALFNTDGGLFDGIFGDENAQERYEEIFEENLIEEGSANMSTGLKNMICRDLAIDSALFDVKVELVADTDKYIADKVTVVLYKGAVLVDPHRVIKYVNGLLDCECEIIYE